MQAEDNKRIAKNTFLLYIRMLFIVIVGLYTSRLILQTLGIVDYGINNVVGGIITFIGFMTNSLAGASSRYITFALGKGNMDYLKSIFNNIISIHLLFAFVILIIGETIGLWFITTQLNIPEDRANAAMWVYQFSILTAMSGFISMPFNAAIIAHEKMSTFAYISIGDTILKLIAVLLLTIVPYDKLITFAFISFVVQFFDFSIYIIYCFNKFEETKIKRIQIDKAMFKELFYYAGWTMNGNLAIFGYTQGLNILLNLFFNPTINAARGIAVQVQNIINNFSNNFQTALNPQLTKSYAQNNLTRMHELLISSSKFSIFLMLLICLPLMLEIEIILKWWLGEYPEYSCIFLRLVLITSILYCLANPIITSIHATGKIKWFQIIEGTLLLSIVPISYICLTLFNIPPYSVFIIHIIIEIITQYARLKIVLPQIKMKMKDYYINALKPICNVMIVAPIIPFIIYLNLKQGFVSFIIICLLSTISSLTSIYFLGCNKNERKIINSKIKQKWTFN